MLNVYIQYDIILYILCNYYKVGDIVDFDITRYKKIFLSFLVTLLLLAGAFKVYQNVYDNQTINMVKQVRGVLNVEIKKSAEENIITVKAGKVDDFSKMYESIQQVIKSRYKKYDIKVVDNRDDYLNKIFYRIHFAIYEAAANNDFVYMKSVIDKNLANIDLDSYKVFIDDNNVYVQLIKGDKYLYEIIPRNIQNFGFTQ